MQKYSAVLSYEGYSPDQFALLVSIAMDAVKWTNTLNDSHEVEGAVKATAWSWGEKVVVQVYQNEAWLTSSYLQWQIPILNKNKKNVDVLSVAIQQLQLEYSPQMLDETREKLQGEAAQFLFDFERRYDSEQLSGSEKVSTGWGGYYATYSLMALIMAVFGAMIVSGISFLAPSVIDIFNWGGNFGPATAGGAFWRLVSHLFVHIGVVHLLLNLYALFSIGLYLEPIIGRWMLLACFLVTGLLGGISSMWWDYTNVSAGASGAIFGLYGVFLSLLITGAVGKEMKASLLSSIGIFIVMNLLYGMNEGIDNASHIGGLIGGIFIGLLSAVAFKWEKYRKLLKGSIIALPILVVCLYLSTVHTKDAEFNLQLVEIAQLDSAADWPITSADGKSEDQIAGEMERISIPKWTEVSQILNGYKPKELSTSNAALYTTISKYTELRLKQASLLIQKVDDPQNFDPHALASIAEKVVQLKAEFKKYSENQ